MAEGVAELPIFTGTPEKGVGIVCMLGGTGGYLVGFVFAAAVCSWLTERGWDRNVVATGLAILAGNVLIYVPGLPWLGSPYGRGKPILEWGLTPVILRELSKLALDVAALQFARKLLRKCRA